MEPISIRTTEVGSCFRKRQLSINYELAKARGYGLLHPLPPNIYPIRGWISHHHIQQWINNEGDYAPDPLIPSDFLQRYWITSDMEPKILEFAQHDFNNFLKWAAKGEFDLSKDNVIGTEYNIVMPLSSPSGVTFQYVRQHDLDLILKDAIIDFKSGSKSYIGKYKTQLGAYRQAARYKKLHLQSPTKDFKLINVFLGDDEPQQQIHDPKKIAAAMMTFEKEQIDYITNDFLCRTDQKYVAPCSVGIYCAFCHWIAHCRGV